MRNPIVQAAVLIVLSLAVALLVLPSFLVLVSNDSPELAPELQPAYATSG